MPRVLVIDEQGNKLGEFLTEDAIRLAEDRGLDLIEVAPNGRPPVCRIQDYGKLKYERKKRATQARKNQVQVQIKEVKLRPKTDDHDIAVKVRHARRFLEQGNKVKVTIRFRGRELAHRDIGAQQCLRVAHECEELGDIETHPRMDGRQMFMIIAPNPRTRARAAERAEQEAAEREATGGPPPAEESDMSVDDADVPVEGDEANAGSAEDADVTEVEGEE